MSSLEAKFKSSIIRHVKHENPTKNRNGEVEKVFGYICLKFRGEIWAENMYLESLA